MKRRCMTCIILFVVILLIPVTAYASTHRALLINPRLQFEGMNAKCAVTIAADTNDEIQATIRLWKGSSLIETWNENGTSYLLFSDDILVTTTGIYTLTVDTSVNGYSKPQFSSSATCG